MKKLTILFLTLLLVGCQTTKYPSYTTTQDTTVTVPSKTILADQTVSLLISVDSTGNISYVDKKIVEFVLEQYCKGKAIIDTNGLYAEINWYAERADSLQTESDKKANIIRMLYKIKARLESKAQDVTISVKKQEFTGYTEEQMTSAKITANNEGKTSGRIWTSVFWGGGILIIGLLGFILKTKFGLL
jgi:hypothetical protein